MKGTITSGRHAQILSGVLLLTVFLAGGMVGAVMSTVAMADEPATPEVVAPTPGLSELGLSTGQKEAIEAVMARYQPAVDSLVGAAIGDLNALVREIDSNVRSLLTAGQVQAYDEMLAKQPRIRAVRRTTDPSGSIVVDTIR
jgi:hypothetical protein